MTASLSTRPIRDGVGNPFLQRVLDVSGLGAGPFLPVLAIAGPEDGAPIDVAGLFGLVGADIAAAADRIEAALAALPAPDAPFVPLGHQSVTVTATAATLAALLTAAAGAITAIPAGTKLILIQPRADGVRYAHGGSTPTTAADATGIGTDLFAGGQYPVRVDSFATLKLVAASDTVVSIEFRG